MKPQHYTHQFLRIETPMWGGSGGEFGMIGWECHWGSCSDLEEWLGVVLVPMGH